MSAEITAQAVLSRELQSLVTRRKTLHNLTYELEGQEARIAESELWDLDVVINWFKARLAH